VHQHNAGPTAAEEPPLEAHPVGGAEMDALEGRLRRPAALAAGEKTGDQRKAQS
jgi:hypothetical protein